MSTKPSGSVSVVLELFRISSHLNGAVQCPDCEGELGLHQPDERNPERLLAVCEQCSGWFVMDSSPDQAAWVGVPLPDAAFFRDVPEQ